MKFYFSRSAGLDPQLCATVQDSYDTTVASRRLDRHGRVNKALRAGEYQQGDHREFEGGENGLRMR